MKIGDRICYLGFMWDVVNVFNRKDKIHSIKLKRNDITLLMYANEYQRNIDDGNIIVSKEVK